MKTSIREMLNAKYAEREEKMSSHVTLTQEQFQQLLDKIGNNSAPKMNPLEQMEYDKKIEAERRKAMLGVEIARIEDQQIKAKQLGCTHCRYPKNHDKAGAAAPRGQGEWVTGGQLCSGGIAALLCLRCAYTWKWKASERELEAMRNGESMAGWNPPAEEICLRDCSYCNQHITNKDYAEHEAACKEKYEARLKG